MDNLKNSCKKISFYSWGLIFILLIINFLPIQATLADNVEPLVSLVSPVGGENFTAGQKITIKWNQTNVDLVTIGYKSCPSCLDWITYNNKVDITNTTGSYDWTIPSSFAAGGNYQIEIIAYHTGVGSKSANSGLFTINSSSSNQITNPTSQGSLSNTDACQSVVKVKTYMLSDSYLLEEIGEGSGVIINPTGLVLTNDHVVSVRSSYDESAYDTSFEICFTKNTNEKPNCDHLAKLVARDKDKDIALLQIIEATGKIETTNFPSLNLSQFDTSQVNDTVTAIGYPSIGEDTITTTNGIISGKTEKYDNQWIKTDAVISFGSSGGAAINSKGELIGITTQVSSDVSGELGYLLNSASIFNWVEDNKNITPVNSSLLNQLIDFTKKQKILEKSNTFIQLYPNYSIIKPADWDFIQNSEESLTISKKSDPDSGYLLIHLLKAPYLTSLTDVKPMLLRYFNENGLSSIIKFTKEKEAKINNFKGKFLTLSVKGKMFNSYVFPHREYLIWIEYSYGKNDKDKKTIDSIVNSFKISADKTKFTENHKYLNSSPKFSLTTNADWVISKQANKVAPIEVQSKKNREAFVTFRVAKIDEAAKSLSNEEFINAKKDEINSNNQLTSVVDYKYTVEKTGARFKLNNNIKEAIYMDGMEKTVGDNKTLAFDRDYYIKIGDSLLNINLTVYTESKKIFDKALSDFNKLLNTLSLK